ncbi:MAG: indole-3-glycerol phosphate synthase TrpC [Myxococcota bacterium]
MSILDEILERKRVEVSELRPRAAELKDRARSAPPAREFASALRSGPSPRVIAELKRASPSRGLIRENVDPAAIVRSYEAAGAVALSVLTDRDFFRGSLTDLCAARDAVSLPLLRKDFVIDPLQLVEARGAGADAVLLIVAALDDPQLRDLLDAVTGSGMEALVEVHTRPELDRALAAGAGLVGINNRDLRTFETDPEVTRRLLPHAGGCTVVSESGFTEARTLRELEASGVHAFLVGETLMQAADPGEALRKLREAG